MIETDKFIKCVRNNPTIWKKNAKGYKDRVWREKCWNIIGQQVFDTWDEKSEEERMEEVINMKNKWRHMRDSFNKYINQGKNRVSVKKRKYIYADNLSFLLQRGNRLASKCSEPQVTEPKQPNEEETNQEVSARIRPKAQTTSRKPTSSTYSNQQQLVKKPTRIEDDSDRCYLLSLLPEFSRLNDDQKLDFRFHTLQFFRVIRSKRMQGFENGWGHSVSETNPMEGAASTYNSPRASRDGSSPNSPRGSVNSDNSSCPFDRMSPPLESVKSELV